MTQVHIKKILLIHTATDTANLICSFITYSSDHGIICDGIKNAFDNIEKTAMHGKECELCENCRDSEEYLQCLRCYPSCCCDYYDIYINIPITSVIVDWKLLFHVNNNLCDCNIIPVELEFTRHPYWICNNTCDECVRYMCSLCGYGNHICSINITYNDGPVHLTLGTDGKNNIILSII